MAALNRIENLQEILSGTIRASCRDLAGDHAGSDCGNMNEGATVRPMFTPAVRGWDAPESEKTKLAAYPEHPLRLLKKPIPVNEHWMRRVRLAEDSDILTRELWHSGLERIYFRAESISGERFWLFKSVSGYFIHGFFD